MLHTSILLGRKGTQNLKRKTSFELPKNDNGNLNKNASFIPMSLCREQKHMSLDSLYDNLAGYTFFSRIIFILLKHNKTVELIIVICHFYWKSFMYMKCILYEQENDVLRKVSIILITQKCNEQC